MSTSIPVAAAILGLCLVAGCAQAEEPADGTTRPSTQPSQKTTLTGTLQGNMAAIGGETTGWVLVGDGATGGMDLDISAVKENATQLAGQRVTVTGHTITKEYVERGRTPILVVDSIEAAPAAD